MRYKSRSRALVGAATAGLLGLAGLTLAAPPASATEDTSSERLEGEFRYETAVAISQDTFAGGSTDVVLATGEDYADALAGNGLAGAVDAPVLLTTSDSLYDATADEIERLGADNVWIMGGVDAVSQSVEDTLVDAGYNVERIGGLHRIETAAMIADAIGADNVGDTNTDQRTAIVVRAFNFPDAVSASSAAFSETLPVLLTHSDMLSDDTDTALTDLGIERVLILGGTDAVDASVATAIEDKGITVDRFFGDFRYDTAVDFAENFLMAELGWAQDNGSAYDLATGEKFPDALAAGPHAGTNNNPIILTPSETAYQPVADFLATNCEVFDAQVVMGGNAAVAQDVADAHAAAAQCETDVIGPNETFSEAAPELVEVMEVEEDVLVFQFDETITGQALKFTGTSPNRQYYGFRLYDPSGNVSYPLEARIEDDSVIARFAGNVTETASRATVRYNAVEDTTGVPNIEGEFPLLPPVVTNATTPFSPQLVRVDNYRTADVILGGTAELLIDYTFNSPTAAADLGLADGTPLVNDDANEFYLVGQFAGEFQADSIQNTQVTAATATDPGETVVTVSFSVDPTDVPESQLRRGYVVADGSGVDTDDQEANSPADGDGEGIVLSEPFESGDDITDVPDLESVTRSGADTYRFEFDEAVSDGALDASRFFVFDAAGNETSATTVARSAQAADAATVVIATISGLPASGAGTPVDAFVADGAVRATDSTDDENDGYNRPDEVVLTLPATDTTQPPAGVTAKPDLVSIARDQNVVTENYSVTFTFDEEFSTLTAAEVQEIAFDLYDENGTQFRVTGVDDSTAGVAVSGDTITFSIDDGFAQYSNEQIAAAVTGGVEDLDDAAEATADITVTEGQTGITDV